VCKKINSSFRNRLYWASVENIQEQIAAQENSQRKQKEFAGKMGHRSGSVGGCVGKGLGAKGRDSADSNGNTNSAPLNYHYFSIDNDLV
jgi:hypothetical protein